jgi:hypothetical protein
MLARLAALAERFAASPWLDLLLAAPAARLRRAVFALLVLHAERRRQKSPSPAAQSQRPRRAPAGFAWRHRRASALRAMIAALIALLADFETEIARMTRRFLCGFTRGRALVAISPPALTLIARADAFAPARADTS